MSATLTVILTQCYGAGTDCEGFVGFFVFVALLGVGVLALVIWGLARGIGGPRLRKPDRHGRCRRCRSLNPVGSTHCWKCGQSLRWPDEPAETPEAEGTGRLS